MSRKGNSVRLEFNVLVGVVLRAFEGEGDLDERLYNEFVVACRKFLRITSTQRADVMKISPKVDFEMASAFVAYLRGDRHILKSLLKTEEPPLVFLRRYRKQFLSNYFAEFYGPNTQQRLYKKIRTLNPPLSFSKVSKSTTEEIQSFLQKTFLLLMDEEEAPAETERVVIRISFVKKADSEKEHSLLSTKDLRHIHAAVVEQFGSITKSDFIDALHVMFPPDIYLQKLKRLDELSSEAEKHKSKGEEATLSEMSSEVHLSLDPGQLAETKKVTLLFWKSLPLGDQFVLTGRYLGLTDQQTKAWGQQHGLKIQRFSDRQPVLETNLAQYISGFSTEEQWKVMSFIIGLGRELKEKYPIDPEI